jgi:hypothetical protein
MFDRRTGGHLQQPPALCWAQSAASKVAVTAYGHIASTEQLGESLAVNGVERALTTDLLLPTAARTYYAEASVFAMLP